jgi:hypothetical protein
MHATFSFFHTVFCDIGRLLSGKFGLQAVHHCTGEWNVCHTWMYNGKYGWNIYIVLDDEAMLWALDSFCINSKLDWHFLQSLVKRQPRTGYNWYCCWNMGQQTMKLPTYCQNRSDMSSIGQEAACSICWNVQAGSWDVGQKCVWSSFSWIHAK